MPIVAPVTKSAATATSAASIVAEVDAACRAARTPHRGPTFVDIPLDAFGPGSVDDPRRRRSRRPRSRPTPTRSRRVAKLVAARRTARVGRGRRRVLGARGSAVARVRRAPRAFRCSSTAWAAARCRPITSSRSRRARSVALKEADLVLVAGTPLDFRLGFGRFGDARSCTCAMPRARSRAHATLAAVDRGRSRRARSPRSPTRRTARPRTTTGSRGCAPTSRRKRAANAPALEADTVADQAGARSTASCDKRLDRDAIVIGDGGDFVSYAGKLVDSFEPGTFLDPGPYGCLGHGSRLRARGRRSRTRTARSCCCSATARSASPSATSRRSCVTA